MIKPILKYPGAKWSRAKWIVAHFPEHEKYLEPYCGSAACFFSKEPVNHEVLGDVNHHLINLFAVIRDHGVELARRVRWFRRPDRRRAALSHSVLASARWQTRLDFRLATQRRDGERTHIFAVEATS